MADITETLQLVHRAQEGDQASLNRLFDRYFPRVLRVVRARMGERLRRWHDSADVIQETFIAAVRRFDDFQMRNEAALINFLSKIAENQIRQMADHIGAKKRDVDRNVSNYAFCANPDDSHVQVDVSDTTLTPLDAAAAEEENQLLDECVGMLPEKQRELILLRNYMGYSWARIAEETGRPSEDAARMAHTAAKTELVLLVKRVRQSRQEPQAE